MKLSLTIKSGTLLGRKFDLSEGFLTIGRGDNCGVRFDPFAENIASKQHAFIESKPDGFYITDYNSTNGTFLNGQKISTAKLNSGDVIQFGKNGSEAAVSIEQIKPTELPTLAAPISENSYLKPDSEATIVKPLINSTDPTAVFSPSIQTQYHASPEMSAQPTEMFQPVSVKNSFSAIGMGAPVLPQVQPSGNVERNLFIGISIFAVSFLTIFVALMIILPNLGFGVAIIASVIAFFPAIFYLLPLIWIDRYDPEPIWLLGLAFAWGALISVIISYKLNTAFAQIAVTFFGVETGMALTAIVSAPIFEEATKGIGVLLLLIFFRKYFDDILDGIVFAGTIALGFATVENVIYYGGAYIRAGSDGLFALFILRGIFSPFAHVTFTAMTGIGCGIARESHNKTVRILMPVVGYICAVFLHFLWNLMATVLKIDGLLEGDWWYGYLFLQFPFFLAFIGFAFYVMRRQNKILNEMLAIDVAQGLIAEDNQKIATSAFRSTGWLISGIFSGKFGARSRYLRAVGKLGLSYWHIQRANAAQGQTASYQQNPILRQEVLKWRDKV